MPRWDPELTAKCFFQDPDGVRGFRSEDLASIDGEGMIVFSGRQLDEVVCWRERCGRRRACPSCPSYRAAKSLPFGLTRASL